MTCFTRRPWSFGRRLLLALPLAVLSCSDAGDPAGLDPGEAIDGEELTFLRFEPTSFQGVPRESSFWAVRGDSRRLELRSTTSGEKVFEFRVDDETLLRRPDGSFFAEGDSILITVTLDPGGRFVFDLQPSGLVFDPDEPAELKIRYTLADQDLNGDGVIDERDREFEVNLAVWKQEIPGDVWTKLASIEVDDDELEAEITSFTGFALAN
jgi:hypothetical protein